MKPIHTWNKLVRSLQIESDYQVILHFVGGNEKSSHSVAVTFDDVAKKYFAYYDRTDSGVPFISIGEIYKSVFIFQSKKDMERFVEMFGGSVVVQ